MNVHLPEEFTREHVPRSILGKTFERNCLFSKNHTLAKLWETSHHLRGLLHDAMQAARRLRKGLDAVVEKLRGRAFEDADLRAILAGLVDDGLAGAYGDSAGAEQAAMAMASVLNFLARRGALADVRGANAALDRVFEAVKDDEKFRAERFQAALASLRTLLAR